MSQPRFNALKETLLRGGVAPRHVTRYMAELEDHYKDLVEEELSRGAQREAAETSAHERLGSNDALAQQMLSRPELKSYAERYPWAVFGIAPPLILAVLVAVGIFSEAGIIKLFGGIPATGAEAPGWAKAAASFWHGVLMYAAPLLVAASICLMGLNRRMPLMWILLGAGSVILIGSMLHIGMVWSDQPGQSSLSVGFGLSQKNMLQAALVRLPISAAVLAGFYWLFWRRKLSNA